MAQPAEVITYRINPTYKGVLRPNLSSNGPYINCPTEMPIKKLDRESEIVATVVFRSFAISGNPGRYMSMENGPIAESNPKIKTSKNLLVGFMFDYTNLM